VAYAPADPVPTVDAGERHAGTELAVTVDGVVLIDAFPEQLIVPEEGNRLLVVRATVENTTDTYRRLSSVDADSVVVDGVPGLTRATPPSTIAVVDDGSSYAVVQPGVPVELAFIWEVADDALEAGDTVGVDLLDRVYIGAGRLTYGGLYDTPAVGARLELEVSDVGAGAGEETEEQG
jgi:hypothetical protein